MKTVLKVNLSGLLTIFVYFLGGFDVALKALLIMMTIDYITGVLSALCTKTINSKIGLKGIAKKFGYLCVVAVSVVIDEILGNLGTIRNVIIYFFVANDGLSIIENLGEMNVPLPEILKSSFEQIKNKEMKKQDVK